MKRKTLSGLAAEVSAETPAETAPAAEPEAEAHPTRRLNVNLDAKMYRDFQRLARREGATMTFLVTQYIKAALEAEDGMPWR